MQLQSLFDVVDFNSAYAVDLECNAKENLLATTSKCDCEVHVLAHLQCVLGSKQ